MADYIIEGIDTAHPTTNPSVISTLETPYRVNKEDGTLGKFIHSDAVYNALLNAVAIMENRLNESLTNYQEHPDIQANLQQLQYDLQTWNLALTTMTNINKNIGDAMSDIAGNFR
jgi:hypothetical protein